MGRGWLLVNGRGLNGREMHARGRLGWLSSRGGPDQDVHAWTGDKNVRSSPDGASTGSRSRQTEEPHVTRQQKSRKRDGQRNASVEWGMSGGRSQTTETGDKSRGTEKKKGQEREKQKRPRYGWEKKKRQGTAWLWRNETGNEVRRQQARLVIGRGGKKRSMGRRGHG